MRKNFGFTMLEVMISMLLFSIVLLGAVMANVSSMRLMRSALYFRQASILAESMAAYLSANGGTPAGYMYAWQSEVRQSLPAAHSRVDSRALLVEVSWGGEKLPCKKIKTGLSGCVVISAE